MVRLAPLSVLPSTYDNFLYAPVGESAHGALLTVLSVLARQNVDPWEEAAELSRLPPHTAAQRLTSMITALPGRPSNQAEVADRLIALLPRRIDSADTAPTALRSEPAAVRSEPTVNWPPPRVNLILIVFYIGVVFLSQWIAASVFQKSPMDGAASSPSTPGETLPSTPRDGPTTESPR
jgi:hypothetical protein